MYKTGCIPIRGMEVSTTKKTSPYPVFYVTSQTDPEKVYLVVNRFNFFRSPREEYICTCPDFVVRKYGAFKVCKHISAVMFLVSVVGSLYELLKKLRHHTTTHLETI